MNLCWPLEMTPPAKATLMALADKARDDMKAWPSVETISRMTCFSKSSVIRSIEWLEKNHALSVKREIGRHSSYVLTPSEYVKPVSECNRCQSATGVTVTLGPVSDRVKPVSLCIEPVSERHPIPYNPLEPPKSNPQNRKREIGPDGFERFWSAYQNTVDSKTCLAKWRKNGLEDIAEQIVSDVLNKNSNDQGWSEGFIPMSTTYLNQQRWLQKVKPFKNKKSDPSKTIGGMYKLEGMKDGTVDGERDSHRISEIVIPRIGSTAGERRD